jgi:hypothetical protein
MAPRDRSLTVQTLAPLLLLIAVGVAILAQAWSAVPIAGAIALAGWGTALKLAERPGGILLTLVVYAPLCLLAMASQLDAASNASLVRQFFVAMDAGAAGGLMVLLARRI